MKIKNILSLALGMILACSSMATCHIVKAEEISTAINLSPMSEKVILIPGERYQGTLKISNPNSSTDVLRYSASVESFSQKKDGDSKDDYGNIDTETVTAYNQIIDWITLGKKSGLVMPNETDVLTYTIDVPADAPAGGQYATIIITDETNHSTDGGNVSIASVSRVASIIYAEVAGETREEGEIVENSIPSFLMNNTLEATSLVRNNGNIHTDAEYVLQVWPIFSDEEICTNEENAATELVMPETVRYHAESCRLPSIGIFRAKQTVKIFGETSIVEKTIIVCPIWLLFLIIFVIVAIIIWIAMRVRARSKKSRKVTASEGRAE